ncbi:hypothetical protein OE766_03610 [Pararhizobium sp. YC-54]|uniref:hypothetical protein n=1 Tax=Pararhizobium sp. YC-54 TaxID=2986920 RepID=UPI0021F6E4B0|nr:hypothetical protein [Pararhizobium sp. YC-54]MCV9997324.1 hypothetical protein [Pararhizobium sp. YC-54]
MKFVAGVFRILIGVVFGLVATVAFSPAAAAFTDGADSKAPLLVLALVVVSALLGFFAPTIRRAFGRGFLLAGLSFLALPLSVMLLSGRTAREVVNAVEPANQGVAAIGSGIAGLAMTGVATFIGLIVGSVLIIIGLVLALGGRREVVIVDSRLR